MPEASAIQGFRKPPFDEALVGQLLALNNAHAHELVFETAERFATVLAAASFLRAEPSGLALFIGFHDGCTYESANFRWFKERFVRFNYIDRVVVDTALQGRGLGRELYAAFEAEARANGRERLVCEINSVPPNPLSARFHKALGFSPVGEQVLEGTGKTVRYWVKELGVA